LASASLRRKILHLDGAAGRREIVEAARDFQNRGLVVDPRARPRAALLELGEDILLLQRRKTDQDGDAEAEQRDHAGGSDPERERQRRDHVGPFEAGGLDALADDEGAGGQPRRRGWGHGGIGHLASLRRQPVMRQRAARARGHRRANTSPLPSAPREALPGPIERRALAPILQRSAADRPKPRRGDARAVNRGEIRCAISRSL
jgi:hypothetical protein